MWRQAAGVAPRAGVIARLVRADGAEEVRVGGEECDWELGAVQGCSTAPQHSRRLGPAAVCGSWFADKAGGRGEGAGLSNK